MKPRHPEKVNNPINPIKKKPSWIRTRILDSQNYFKTKAIINTKKLHTVCQEASCPNISECWSKKHATFMVMGDMCTRACAFCNVKTGKPTYLDPLEPLKIAQATKELDLKHVVITSVDRDDLKDGGAEHFSKIIIETRKINNKTTIEVLTPDFYRKGDAYQKVVNANPDVFNHNIETVPSLYLKVRPGSRYFASVNLLKSVKEINDKIFTKSGIMLGLGETRNEVLQVMDDLLVDYDGKEDVEIGDVKTSFKNVVKTEVRNRILDGVRPDGRGSSDLRSLAAETGLSPRAHGSGLFTRGETQVLSLATLGTPREAQILDTLSPLNEKRYMHHYNFPPYSTGETWFLRGPKRREIGHGALAETALRTVLPDEDDFAYTLRVVSEVLSSNGSTSMASVCGSTLALMDAGVPIKKPVGGIAMGLVKQDEPASWSGGRCTCWSILRLALRPAHSRQSTHVAIPISERLTLSR